MLKNSPLCQFLHAQGTPAFIDMDQARGSLPTNNHRDGGFDKFTEINSTKLHSLVKFLDGLTILKLGLMLYLENPTKPLIA